MKMFSCNLLDKRGWQGSKIQHLRTKLCTNYGCFTQFCKIPHQTANSATQLKTLHPKENCGTYLELTHKQWARSWFLALDGSSDEKLMTGVQARRSQCNIIYNVFAVESVKTCLISFKFGEIIPFSKVTCHLLFRKLKTRLHNTISVTVPLSLRWHDTG